jgi:hypothetical protein
MTSMTDHDTRSRPPFLVYLLPVGHLCACFVIELAKIERGWEQLIWIDFPVSFVAVAMSWRNDQPLLWFGIVGTMWWYLVSWTAWRVFSARRRQQVKTGGA